MNKNDHRPPPRFWTWLVERCAGREIRARVLGDLFEQFADTTITSGAHAARREYRREAIRSAGTLVAESVRGRSMLAGNQLTVAARRIRRYPTTSLINVGGFTVAVTACLLLLFYVRSEFSFDRHFPDGERLYRVAMSRPEGDDIVQTAATPRPLAAELESTIPEIDRVVRLSRERTEQVLVRSEEHVFFEEGLLFSDSSFFNVFGQTLLQGDPSSALTEPRSVVLTREMAHKYFGNADPIGHTIGIRLRGDGTWFDYTVTGVSRGMPAHTHFHFDFLASYELHPFAFDRDGMERRVWSDADVYTYAKLNPGTDPGLLSPKLSSLAANRIAPALSQTAAAEGYRGPDLFLQPVQDIHLKSNLQSELETSIRQDTVQILLLVAFFVLVIASVNFVNISTANAVRRAHEVGVRRALGSYPSQVAGQFLMEAVLTTTAAFTLALLASELLLEPFGRLVGRPLPHFWARGSRDLFWLLAASLTVGLAAGAYPARVMASFRPSGMLSGTSPGQYASGRSGRAFVRSVLVVAQFFVATVVVVGTVTLFVQMRFISSKPLGFQKEHVVVVDETHVLRDRIETYRASLLAIEGVERVATSEAVPGRALGRTPYMIETPNGPCETELSRMYTGFDFAETMGLSLVEGRSPAMNRAGDSTAALLNVSAVAALGLDAREAIGQRLVRIDGEVAYTIIGVVDDFHFSSLRAEIGPLAIFGPDPFFENRPRQTVVARISNENTAETLDRMRAVWNDFMPGQPFRFSFLDAEVDALYRSEARMESMLALFCALALLLATLGLFGLATLTAQQKRKEIGIRKALGASSTSVAWLLVRTLALPVVLAFVLAAPGAYVYARRWLDGFAYRTDATWEIIVLTGILLALVAAFAVGIQATRSARSNPVTALAEK